MTPALILLLHLSATEAFSISFNDLQPGDLLLQSLPCRLCRLIEEEEESPYSHVAIVGEGSFPLPVYQAFGRVGRLPLEGFLRQTRTGTRVRVLRPRGFDPSRIDLESRFRQGFEGLSYDPEFLWDNTDEHGEKLYCSEFVLKLLGSDLPVAVPLKPMHFVRNREEWVRHFKGHPPDGAPGLSPGDLHRSRAFSDLGELELP